MDADGTASPRTAFTFPRGPVAGSCLHRIFELLDTPSATEPATADLEAICRDALEDFGIDAAWKPVARAMVERTRSLFLREPNRSGLDREGSPSRFDGPAREAGLRGAPGPKTGTRVDPEALSTRGSDSRGEGHGEGHGEGRGEETGDAISAAGFRLGDPVPRLVELEFHFPVEGLERERLAACLVEHGYRNPFDRSGDFGARGTRAPPIHGFLRGYVDLVVEHAGRWYVIDYKSNWLGSEPDDYSPEAVGRAMHEGGYAFQYLIYLVALHRYLTVRLPGYRYERHVGGAFYLFVRGIDPKFGMRRGVYFDRPSVACLHALDGCFRGVGA